MNSRMHIKLRQEEERDHEMVAQVIRAAFLKAEHASGKEAELVERLRAAEDFIPALSMVAVSEEKVVGHIVLSPIKVESHHLSLALAPVSVHPDYQRQGIGQLLIEAAHARARELGYHSVILVGHPTYYPKFGYQRASCWGIKAPFAVPDEAFMAIELVPHGLKNVSGLVSYPPAFDEVSGHE